MRANYLNIGHINQEIASVHLASGVLGRFINSVGHSKVEQQMRLLGGDLDTEDLDLLVDSGCKSISQLLADEHIDVNDIAPLAISADIPITPVPSSLPLPALPVPLVPSREPTAAPPSKDHVSSTAPPADSCARVLSSSPLSYIDEVHIEQPQSTHPIPALSLGGAVIDPLRTPTFRPVSSPPAVTTAASTGMIVDMALPPIPAPSQPTPPIADSLELQEAHNQLAALQKATAEAEVLLEAKKAETQKAVELLVYEQHKADAAKRAAVAAAVPKLKDSNIDYSRFFVPSPIIGSLLWLTLGTCPDIAEAVIKLSQFSVNPSKEHIDKALYVLKYVNTTINCKIAYTKKEGFIAFADADWATDEIDRKSIFFLFFFYFFLNRKDVLFVI